MSRCSTFAPGCLLIYVFLFLSIVQLASCAHLPISLLRRSSAGHDGTSNQAKPTESALSNLDELEGLVTKFWQYAMTVVDGHYAKTIDPQLAGLIRKKPEVILSKYLYDGYHVGSIFPEHAQKIILYPRAGFSAKKAADLEKEFGKLVDTISKKQGTERAEYIMEFIQGAYYRELGNENHDVDVDTDQKVTRPEFDKRQKAFIEATPLVKEATQRKDAYESAAKALGESEETWVKNAGLDKSWEDVTDDDPQGLRDAATRIEREGRAFTAAQKNYFDALKAMKSSIRIE